MWKLRQLLALTQRDGERRAAPWEGWQDHFQIALQGDVGGRSVARAARVPSSFAFADRPTWRQDIRHVRRSDRSRRGLLSQRWQEGSLQQAASDDDHCLFMYTRTLRFGPMLRANELPLETLARPAKGGGVSLVGR